MYVRTDILGISVGQSRIYFFIPIVFISLYGIVVLDQNSIFERSIID